MVFFILFRFEIIRVLFERGRFDSSCVEQTGLALLYFSFGIPAFSTVKILLTGFYANKDMKTPVKISFLCIGVNVILNFVLMWDLKQGGIALATVISAILNNVLLYYFLRKKLGHIPLAPVIRTSILSLALSIVFAFLSLYISQFVPRIKLPHVSADILPLLGAGISFWIFYIVFSLLFKSKEVPEILSMFKRREKGAGKA
jgi:putative peptidoglycan lipid II flippase